jgi:hypothetical protein
MAQVSPTVPLAVYDQPSVAQGTIIGTLAPGVVATVQGSITNADGAWTQVDVPSASPGYDTGFGIVIGGLPDMVGWVLQEQAQAGGGTIVPLSQVGAGPSPSLGQMWSSGASQILGATPSLPSLPGLPSLPTWAWLAIGLGAVLLLRR